MGFLCRSYVRGDIMLSSECIWAYREQFGDSECAFAEPSSNIFVVNPDTGIAYISSGYETDEEFFNRLERCKQEHRNLFFEEWDEFVIEPGVLY